MQPPSGTPHPPSGETTSPPELPSRKSGGRISLAIAMVLLAASPTVMSSPEDMRPWYFACLLFSSAGYLMAKSRRQKLAGITVITLSALGFINGCWALF
ncbi:hypothetical protein OKA04_21790 [Luteolibacter flavescens]|uniref:Uncharacterized protein n=1 Tax=Luteolibacter flavescens TaxID=1859460 RepID=A0ABT3FV00_9BACT|nr:hypothetical protein [Luteolibacter flavescens]MCW1887385.1 hypothetical protein [Luteolibacter flavescens]